MAVERHFICNVNDVPDCKGREFIVNGISIALFRVSSNFYALENRCSNGGVPIAGGYVHKRDLCVACPSHGDEFDLRTGKVMVPPASEDIKSFEVSVEEEKVLIIL
jgi:nitrite reductase/ring-hydroxylating ferredoxin subunit